MPLSCIGKKPFGTIMNRSDIDAHRGEEHAQRDEAVAQRTMASGADTRRAAKDAAARPRWR